MKVATPILENLLDSRIDLTHRELFHAKILSETISGLQCYKRSGKFKNSILQTIDRTPPKPSFLCVTVNNLPLMLQVDNGASYSIVSTSLVDKLNLATIETTPVVLQGITGTGFTVNHAVNITIYISDHAFQHVFLVLDRPSCDLLVGIDFLKRFQTITDYSDGHDHITLIINRTKVISQLYSRNEALTHINADYVSDNSDSSDSSSESELDDKGIDTLNFLSSKLTENQRSSVESILHEFDDIFAKDYSEIPGIKFQDHQITLEPHAKPIASRFPLFSPQQRQ